MTAMDMSSDETNECDHRYPDNRSVIELQLRLPLDTFALDLAVELGKPMTALYGPSGAGKTSLLEVIAGLRRPSKGSIRIDGELVFDSEQNIALGPERRRIGYVPQDALLFPHMDVRRNLLYGARATGDISISSVSEALEIEPLLDRRPGALSGGERQRVSLGRALLSDPRFLLLDEPLAAIDVGLKERILPYLLRVRDQYGIPALVVSHNIYEVLTLCDEVVVLERGRIKRRGTPRAVLTGSATADGSFSGRFENVLDVRVVSQEPAEGITRVTSAVGLDLCIPYRAARPDRIGAQSLVGIYAEDILLALHEPTGLSARNIVTGRVESIDEVAGAAMVRVATPEPIYVKLTHGATAQLGIRTGTPVHLIVKTHSIHRMG